MPLPMADTRVYRKPLQHGSARPSLQRGGSHTRGRLPRRGCYATLMWVSSGPKTMPSGHAKTLSKEIYTSVDSLRNSSDSLRLAPHVWLTASGRSCRSPIRAIMCTVFELLHIIPKEPYSSYMFDENSLEQCKSERGEGSKIGRVWWVDSIRPVKIAHKMPHSCRNACIMAASRAPDISARPDIHGIWYSSQVPSTDLVTHDGPQSPEPA